MVNWKKFFAEDDIAEQNAEDQYKNYEKIKKDNKKSKLEAWFEEDYSKKNFDKLNDEEANEQFEIEYTHNNAENNENEYYYEEDIDENFAQEKKSSFFSKILSSKKNNDKLEDNNEYYDEQYDDEDLYDDSEINVENIPKEKESFLTKIINLFKEPKTTKQEQNEYIDEIIDDEPEDYKTYFERQKQQRKNNSSEDIANNYAEFEEEYSFEDDLFDEHEQEKNKNQSNSPFSKIKNKFNSIANYGLKEDNDFENEDLDLPENEPIKEKSHSKLKEKKEQFLAKMLKTKEEEKLELEFDEHNEESDTINDTFELEMKETLNNSEEKTNEDFEIEEEKSIKDTLNSFGIEATAVKDFDVFKDNREERRQHPTLAAMKVKRRIQDKKIEELGTNIVLEDNKEKFSKDIFSSKQEEKNIETKENLRISKKSAEREQLNNDFNKITRKNISDNNISNSEEEKEIDNFIQEIKYHEENSKKDIRNYDIEISESDSEKDRREKLKYTTVNEVLEGNEDLFEDDIDKTSKFSEDNIDNVEHPEELKQFRNDVFRKKTSADLLENNQSELDNLIIETNIVEKANAEFSPEITKLEENLQLIKQEAVEKNDIPTEDTTEISIEKIAKDSEIHYPEYDELKQQSTAKTTKNIIDDYSDYNLDYSEIEELNELNKIDSISKSANIESLTKDLSVNNNISKTNDIVFEENKYTQENYKYQNIEQDTASTELEDSSEQIGIDYVEKLYINDTQDYFVDDNSPLVFGEYKTKDYGYRPVSKEKIESNQRKLDAIFEKYSNVKIPKRNTTSYVEQKISSPANKTIGKYKPSTVYSSIYGSSGVPNKKNEVISDNKKKINVSIDNDNKHSHNNIKSNNNSASNNKNLFKEIAKQEESVWNIDLGSRVPKKNKNNKI